MKILFKKKKKQKKNELTNYNEFRYCNIIIFMSILDTYLNQTATIYRQHLYYTLFIFTMNYHKCVLTIIICTLYIIIIPSRYWKAFRLLSRLRNVSIRNHQKQTKSHIINHLKSYINTFLASLIHHLEHLLSVFFQTKLNT